MLAQASRRLQLQGEVLGHETRVQKDHELGCVNGSY